MGFFSDIGSSLGFESGSLGGSLDAFSGKAGADAALEGAQAQTQLGRDALAVNREAEERMRQRLSPFVGVGTDALGQANQLFGADAAGTVMNDPAFQAAADRQELEILNRQSAQGRLNTAETGGALMSGFSNLGSDFLSRQRGDVLNAVQLGQASAAQTAASNLQGGASRGSILSGIGNAQAAGGMGAAQSMSQGTSNIASLAGGIMSMFSDRRLKRNISEVGTWKGYKTYTYQYKDHDTWYKGVMSEEVREKNPMAITSIGGYDSVNYGAL
jgi:hypothetical protein